MLREGPSQEGIFGEKFVKKPANNLLVSALVLSLTLGLAPFFPEPHLFGKLRWVLGGAEGMKPMDYFDLVFHGAPWVVLLILVLRTVRS